MRRIAASLLLAGLLAGCGAPPAARRVWTVRHVQVLRDRGRQGDWLVIAGIHAGDQLVRVTTVAELTHAALLDLDRGQAIEAVSPAVQAVPLERFVDKADRLLLIRPHCWTAQAGSTAVERARGRLGAPYDFLGTIGLPSEKRFYCTELTAWAYGLAVDRKGPHRVLHPRRMRRLGEVVFDSGRRE